METILVFGAGELQLSLIETVQRLGFKAIAIDPDPHAMGKEVACEFFSIAPNDFSATLDLASRNNTIALVTSATDNPIIMMARVAERLDLRFPSVESVSSALDKSKFKQILSSNLIPCARGICVENKKRFVMSNIDYPVIVKPNKGSGSRGVILCNNDKELESATKQTLRFCRDDRYIVEEYISGDEISVEALIFNKKLEIVQITDKIVGPPPYNVEYGHIQPSKYSYLKQDIQFLLQRVIDSVGLDNCAVHPEFKVNNNGLFIIEIGPRLGGDFIASHLVPLSTGTNMEEAVICIATGADPKISVEHNFSMIQYLSLPQGSLITKGFSHHEIIDTHPSIKQLSINLYRKQIINPITSSVSRYGYWIITGKDRESMIAESEIIFNSVMKSLGVEPGGG